MGNERMIDLNKASVEILETLRGVGRAKAEEIVALRKIVGFFGSLEDILVVPGIGRNILEINQGILHLSHRPIRRSLRRLGRISGSSIEGLAVKRSSLRIQRKAPYLDKSVLESTVMINSGNKELESSPSKSTAIARTSPVKTESCSSKQLTDHLEDNSRPNNEKDEIDLHCDEEDPEDDDSDDDNSEKSDDDSEKSDDDDQFNDMFDFADDDIDTDMHSHWPMPLEHGNLSGHSTLDECNSGSPRLKQLCSTVGDGPSRVFLPNSLSDSTLVNTVPMYSNIMKLKYLKTPSGVGSLGTDTPHDEVGDIPLDVQMFPMRLTDGELESEGQDTSGSERMVVDDSDVLGPDKKQNKRKSDLCSDSRTTCPVKKSCKDIDSNLICEKPKSSVVTQSRQPPRGLKSWLSKFQSWTPVQKILALDSLIDVCDLSQVRHIHQIILPQFQRDFISLLPKELALYVLSFLEPKDLLRAAQTCKYWNILAADNLLWREKCREDGLEDHLGVLNIRRKKGTCISHMSPYKSAYMRQHRIEMNWRTHPLKPPRVLKGHDDHVITCLQFSGNTVVSGSDDNTLKVWNATTGKCVRTLTGHTGGVWSSQMAGNTIVSGSTDRMLRVWNAETGECKYMLYGHTSTVRCLHLHGDKVVSGSRDATLRVWDVKTGTCERVLMGHVAAVRCVQYNGKLVVSGAYDYMVKVWNPDREECLHTLEGHTNRVYSLQFDGVHVVSGSLDTSIRVWDVDSGQCKHTLMGHQSLTSGMELKNNILISGNADSTVKVWDILTGQCLQTLSGSNKHRSAVTCLQFNQKFVVTSSDDGTVKLWDVKSGQFIRNLVALESGGSGGVVWRIRASDTKLVCAVGSRNGTEETKLLVLDFDVPEVK